jgi:hypothetical protein
VFPIALVLVSSNANAAGISVDAGLTPAEDRWIIRTLLHYMQRDEDHDSMNQRMDNYALNIVLAYGVRRNLTLLLKQPIVHREMLMSGIPREDTGLADLSLLVKSGLYRRNTRDYTLGVAAMLGLELPTGADVFTSETWDIKPGLYVSGRRGPWASDFNTVYAWNGFADKSIDDVDPGDELSLDAALARQFSIGEEAEIALAPVLELSWRRITQDRLHDIQVADTGESTLYISPGIKFTRSSLILETLIRIPVLQELEGLQLKRSMGVLVGSRYMF